VKSPMTQSNDKQELVLSITFYGDSIYGKRFPISNFFPTHVQEISAAGEVTGRDRPSQILIGDRPNCGPFIAYLVGAILRSRGFVLPGWRNGTYGMSSLRPGVVVQMVPR
jgi:hypothetical protein